MDSLLIQSKSVASDDPEQARQPLGSIPQNKERYGNQLICLDIHRF
jgi:hypothetical protein